MNVYENETTLHFPRTFYNNAKFFQYEKAKQIRKRHSFLNYFHQIYKTLNPLIKNF